MPLPAWLSFLDLALLLIVLCSWHTATTADLVQFDARWHQQYHAIDHTPKIYVYELPVEITVVDLKTCNSFTCSFANWVRKSPHYEPDGDKADYFLIPHEGIPFRSLDEVNAHFNYVIRNFPWWNRTVAANQTRHLMVLQSDYGPVDGGFREGDKAVYIGSPLLSPEWNPASPTRVVAFLTLNGLRDGIDNGNPTCGTCFQLGKDIQYPTPQNVCGPLCGYNISVLRQHGLWNHTGKSSHHWSEEFSKPRQNRLFYAGGIPYPTPDDRQGRGGIYYHYVNRSGYLIARNNEHERVHFAEEMRRADWCFSPMGTNGGDSDRYGAAIMFGCIPVMLNSTEYWTERIPRRTVPNAFPLEEVLPWHLFSTMIDVSHIDRLHEQLQCLHHMMPRMRAALAGVWRTFLYTSLYGSYFGEDDQHDAFAGIMAVLSQRTKNNYEMPPHVRHRLEHRERFFPCLVCKQVGQCGEPSPNLDIAGRRRGRCCSGKEEGSHNGKAMRAGWDGGAAH